MNIPNLLTVLRIVFVPVIVIFIIQGHYLRALVCLVIAGITDGLDGFLARALNQKTVIGSYLDPIADKTLVISMFAALGIAGLVPGWLSVIVISRDCMILGGIIVLTILSVPLAIRPSLVSKATTAIQLVTLVAALAIRVNGTGRTFKEAFIFLIWATAFFTIISGVDYIVKGLDLLNRVNKKTEES